MAIERISVIGVPVDICTPDKLEDQILELLLKPGTKQIVFLSIWDLLKARKRKGDFAECIKSADLILPISKSILKGAKFLKKNVPYRYNPFSAVIQILSIMDSHYKSLYMLGSHQKTLQTAERNVHRTFPNLKIVGRYVGYYPKTIENDIVNSIFKKYELPCEVVAASFKTKEQVVEIAKYGIYGAAIGVSVWESFLNDKIVDEAIDVFNNDFELLAGKGKNFTNHYFTEVTLWKNYFLFFL